MCKREFSGAVQCRARSEAKARHLYSHLSPINTYLLALHRYWIQPPATYAIPDAGTLASYRPPDLTTWVSAVNKTVLAWGTKGPGAPIPSTWFTTRLTFYLPITTAGNYAFSLR